MTNYICTSDHAPIFYTDTKKIDILYFLMSKFEISKFANAKTNSRACPT